MKKIISLLLAFIMILTPVAIIGPFDVSNFDIFSLFSFPAYAEEEEEPYDPSLTSVTTAAGLSALTDGAAVRLDDDIYITDAYTPISANGVTIDGRGSDGKIHTIWFGPQDGSGVTGKALFSSNTFIDGVTIKNVNLKGKVIVNSQNAHHCSPLFYGDLAASGFKGVVTLSNIKSSVNVHAQDMCRNGDNEGEEERQVFLAGFLTRIYGATTLNAKNIEVTGKITNSGDWAIMYVSGMFTAIDGTGNSTLTFDKCINNGKIEITGKRRNDTATQFFNFANISGLLGKVGASNSEANDIIIKNCENNADIQIGFDGKEADFGRAGGLAYDIWGWNVKIENCKNTGDIIAPFNILTNPQNSSEQYKYASTFSPKTAGAIAGLITDVESITQKIEVYDCENRGNISIGMSEDGRTGISGIFSQVRNVENVIIKRCINYGNIEIDDFRGNVGGIIATAHTAPPDEKSTVYPDQDLLLEDCENHGNITFHGITKTLNAGIGGIIGMVENQHDDDFDTTVTAAVGKGSANNYKINKTFIINCRNKGTIKSAPHPTQSMSGNLEAVHVGGIAGRCIALAHMELRHCINEGTMDIKDYRENNYGWTDTAGIVGGFMTITPDYFKPDGDTTFTWSGINNANFYIYDCHNVGNISGLETGGILGSTWQLNRRATINIHIEGCSNFGTIKSYAGGHAGGIAGGLDKAEDAKPTVTIKSCFNAGEVTSTWVAAGILASRGGDTTAENTTITDCANYATITATDASGVAAGIFAQVSGPVTINNCVSWGLIQATTIDGGIVGNVKGNHTATVTTSGNSYYSGSLVMDSTLGSSGIVKGEDAVVKSTLNTKILNVVYKSTANMGANYAGSSYAPATHTNYIVHEAQLQHAKKDSVALKLARNGISFTANTKGLDRTLTDSTLDGENRTVVIDGNSGMFSLLERSSVKDLTINVVNLERATDNAWVGFLSHKSSGSLTLDNIKVTGTITSDPAKDLNIGGLVALVQTGNSQAVITNCQFGATINYFASATVGADRGGIIGNVGGLVGTAMGNVTFEKCKSAGTIKSQGLSTTTKLGDTACGGIVAAAERNTLLKDCTSSTSITIEDKDCWVGGLVGHMFVQRGTDKLVIQDCTNSGALNCYKSSGIVGGICFYNYGYDNTSDASFTKEVYDSFENATLTVENCTNTGAITGRVLASGIAGDLNDNIAAVKNLGGTEAEAACPRPKNVTIKNCLNTGTILTTLEVAGGSHTGGIVATCVLANIIECINQGNVTGYDRTGGIVGNKHTVDTEGIFLVENCKNSGTITAKRTYAGGIVSFIWRGIALIKGCVNTGRVIADMSDTSAGALAGGIVAYVNDGWQNYEETVEMGCVVEIDRCVNAGSVETRRAAQRTGDPWVSVGGIVGGFRFGMSITNCVHIGTLKTDAYAATPKILGTFPIANAVEFYASLDHEVWQHDPILWFNYENNYYAAGSAQQAESLYRLSTKADAATLEAAIRKADVYWFDRTCINDDLTLATNIKNGTYATPPYTAEQLTKLTTEISDATAVKNGTNVWDRQNSIYNAEDELIAAIYAYDSSNESYTVTLPEYAGTGFNSTISVQVNNFTYFSSIKLEATSKNGFVLRNGSSWLLYSFQDENGAQYTPVGKTITIIDEAPRANVTKKITKTIKPVLTANQGDKPGGTYRDTLSFTVTYSDGKPY